MPGLGLGEEVDAIEEIFGYYEMFGRSFRATHRKATSRVANSLT